MFISGLAAIMEPGRLVRRDEGAVAVLKHLGLARANGDHGGVAGGVGIDAVFAGTQQSYGTVRGIDFIGIVLIELAEADFERALVEAHLDDIVIEIEEAEVGVGVETDGGAADVELGMGSLVDEEMVAGGEGIVQGGVVQVSTVAGWKATSPEIQLRRATRDGGSPGCCCCMGCCGCCSAWEAVPTWVAAAEPEGYSGLRLRLTEFFM